MDLMDRIFWGLLAFVGIHFIWLGALEKYLSLYAGTAVATAVGVWFVCAGDKFARRLRLGERLGGWLYGRLPDLTGNLTAAIRRKLGRGK